MTGYKVRCSHVRIKEPRCCISLALPQRKHQLVTLKIYILPAVELLALGTATLSYFIQGISGSLADRQRAGKRVHAANGGGGTAHQGMGGTHPHVPDRHCKYCYSALALA